MRPPAWLAGPVHELPPAIRAEPRHGARPPAVARGRALAEHAAAHHGVADLQDLAAAGWSRGAVARGVAAGALHRRHRGVYAVGHPRLSREGRWLAAVRAYGREAVLSHRDGAALQALRRTQRASIDVSAPGGRHGSHDGVVLHRAVVPPEDRCVVDAIPCTTVARTLVDLGDVLPARAVELAIEQAVRDHIFDLVAVREVAARRFGTRGAAVLLEVLDAWTGGTWTRSELEEALLALVDRAGLPRPRCNASIAGVEVDAVWPAARLAVEVDGFAFHDRTPTDFARDRHKEEVLDEAGWRLVRLGWRQLEDRPDAVAARLARHLGARS